MQPIRDHAPRAQPLRQPNRKQHIRRLALPVRHKPPIPIYVAPKCLWQRAQRRSPLLGRHVVGAALEVVVVEADGREAQAQARDVDDASGAVGGEELWREQVG